MKLFRLTVSNFMPYKGPNSIDFPQDEARNVMLVFGENMRGKTSLLNALRWGFYSKAVGRHSRNIPLQEIVNKDAALEGDWRVEVFVSFEANGSKYELRRSADRKGHVVTPARPEDFAVSVHLTRDGIVISGDQIEAEISQFAPEQISRFFLFDGELLQEYEALLIEGSEQGRQIKEAIEQVLGVPSLTNGRSELGAILKAATKKQNHELAHVQGLERQAEMSAQLTSKLESQEKDLAGLQGKLTNTRAERSTLEDELEGAASILALKASLDSARAMLKAQTELRDRKRIERQGLLAQAWQDLLDRKLEVKREWLRARQSEITSSLKARVKIDTQVQNIRDLLATNECPTCEQSLSPEKRAGLGTTLGNLEVEAKSHSDVLEGFEDISAQLSTLDKIRGVNARDRLVEIDKDARGAEVMIQRAENDIERYTDQVAGHDTAELARKRVMASEALKEEAGSLRPSRW